MYTNTNFYPCLCVIHFLFQKPRADIMYLLFSSPFFFLSKLQNALEMVYVDTLYL